MPLYEFGGPGSEERERLFCVSVLPAGAGLRFFVLRRAGVSHYCSDGRGWDPRYRKKDFVPGGS